MAEGFESHLVVYERHHLVEALRVEVLLHLAHVLRRRGERRQVAVLADAHDEGVALVERGRCRRQVRRPQLPQARSKARAIRRLGLHADLRSGEHLRLEAVHLEQEDAVEARGAEARRAQEVHEPLALGARRETSARELLAGQRRFERAGMERRGLGAEEPQHTRGPLHLPDLTGDGRRGQRPQHRVAAQPQPHRVVVERHGFGGGVAHGHRHRQRSRAAEQRIDGGRIEILQADRQRPAALAGQLELHLARRLRPGVAREQQGQPRRDRCAPHDPPLVRSRSGPGRTPSARRGREPSTVCSRRPPVCARQRDTTRRR